MSKYIFGLKTILQDGLPETEIYAYLIYEVRKIIGKTDFSVQS